MRKIMVYILIFVTLIGVLAGCRQKSPLPADGAQIDGVASRPSGEGPVAGAGKTEPQLPGALLVMVENHPEARPQSGLDKADVVYEALTEGGITRFLAVFYSRKAEKIGPVRSARLYFVQIAKAYDSPYAHAGGNNDALALIPRLKIKDLDEIYNSGGFFWRIKGRKLEHTLYTSTDLLLEGSRARGLSLTPLKPLPEGIVGGGSSCEEFSITYANYRGYKYVTSYSYKDGTYRKLVNGEPFLMEDGSPITAKNVIVLFAKTTPVSKDQTDIEVIGKGDALFFTAGKVYQGTWRKASASDHFEYIYEGKPMRFAKGTTWIQIVPRKQDLSYGLP